MTRRGPEQGKFLNPDAREPVDPRRCRVCGHLTLTPARRAGRAALWAIIGALLFYIAIDVFENGPSTAASTGHSAAATCGPFHNEWSRNA